MIHHLYHKSEDQGFIQVRCKLKGPLNRDLFHESWKRTAAVYSAFRTSFHWDNLDKPIQVVHPAADLKMHYWNWESKSSADIDKLEHQFRQDDQKIGFDLTKVPISRVNLIKISGDQHILFWTCHHLLFDGWSGVVVLEDVFQCYHNLCTNVVYQSESVPDQGKYFDWISGIDLEEAEKFWTHYLGGFHKPTLIGKSDHHLSTGYTFVENVIRLSEQKTGKLKSMLRQNRVTVNTYIRAVWGLLLGRISDTEDVVFGATVSGRSGNIPQIERMVGLLMNVLPVRIKLKPYQSFSEYMLSLQSQQLAAFNFEHTTQDLITSWLKWPSHLPLYDSLLVTQNINIKDLKAGDLEVVEAEGKISSIHPLTIIVEPKDHNLTIILRYNPKLIDKKLIHWIAKNFLTLTDVLNDSSEVNLAQVGSSISNFHVNNRKHKVIKKAHYLPPTSDSELQLTRIWEETLGIHPIGVNDNFFNIGGNSFQAVKLFSRIHQTTGRNLSPSMLIQFPTISKLARAWQENNHQSSWDSLVPLRARGTKPPLFAIHGGGGHVFFHQPLARHLDQDQPVYALQPVGLDNEKTEYKSIEQIAGHYLEVIRKVRPAGSFSLLSTCLGDPICVEINNQMRALGEIPIAIIIVDSYPEHLFTRKIILTPMEFRVERFRERFRQSPYAAIRKMIVDRINRLFKPVKLKWDELRVQYGSDDQARILLNMSKQLQRLYFQYHWRPFEGKVTLIRTSQNVDRINNRAEEVWSKLASDKVDLLIIPGGHYQRFVEPNVIELSKQLQSYLDRLYHKL